MRSARSLERGALINQTTCSVAAQQIRAACADRHVVNYKQLTHRITTNGSSSSSS